jgi:uncharacterized protein YbjT (DUF2867 family)
MAQILIVGGSGTVGSELVKILKAEGHSVRVATSKPATDSEKVHVNLVTGEGLDAAFEGVDRLFMLSPGTYTDQYGLLAPLVRKAKEANLKKVVLMTALGVEHAEGTPFRRVELDLIASGVPYNIIRPSWFSQNFVNFWGYGIKNFNAISLPVGDGKTGFIDSRDISAVAAKLLTTDTFSNQEFTLTGPEALTHAEVAKVIADATGKPVVFKENTPDELRPVLLGAGIPADYVEVLITILGYIKAGYTNVLTDSVEKILGRKPRDFKSYAQEAAGSWK